MSSLHPGLQVFYSNQVERLAAQLALDLALFRGEEGAWKSAPLVVPNPNVRDYLRGAFAEAFGAVANLQFGYLEGFWARHASRPLLDHPTLVGSILSLLQGPRLGEDPALAPLRRYLEGAPADLKAVQLAQRLAQHLERLLLHRPDWIRSWDRDQVARGAEPTALEAWQRALWRQLRQAWSHLPDRPLPLMDWMEDPGFTAAPFPEALFLFGMSHIAPVYHRALARVGTRASVRLYLVNPCLEPWDLDAGRRPPSGPPEGEDPYALHRDRGEIILQRWARPAREQLRLLAEVAQGDCLGKFHTPEAPTLLAHLQRRLLAPEQSHPVPEPQVPGRASLRLIPCPSPRREAETVASLVWDLVQAGGLHFGDIGILVPPAEEAAYLEHLGAAFRGAHGIPWAKALGASRSLQDLVEACLLLLDLGSGTLSRADLLRAVRHPFIQERLGIAPGAWGSLCERAGIVAGLDAGETAGTYAEGGRWTWDEGLTRLALGRFMKPDAVIAALGPMGRPVGAPEAAPMLALLGPLAEDLRALSRGRHGLPVWRERLARFLRTYLGPDPEAATELETGAFEQVLRTLQRITLFQVEGLPEVALDFQALRPLVRAALEGLLGDSALPPGRGVQVSCYTPLRAIPFQALFLMGLGEGLFPGTDRPDPLDLVASSPRRAGDVSRAEQDRQLFLEAVLCARRELVLTYPSRTPTTGDERQPSPLLLDLEETLGPEVWARIRCPEQPLHRHDLSLFPDLDPAPPGGPPPLPCHLPAARQEAEARALGLKLRAGIGGRDLPRHLASWGGSPELRSRLRALTGACGPFGEPGRLPGRLHLTLRELRRWLECPVQGGVALRLGVREADGEDPAEVAEVPTDSDHLAEWGLLRRSFWTRAVEGSDLESVYARLRAEAERTGRVPIGSLSLGERRRHLATLQRWESQVGPPADFVLHRFGTGQPFETLGLRIQQHDPLRLDLPQATEIRLEGLTEPMRDGEFLLLSTSDWDKQGPALKGRLESLRAWLAHLALCAAGEGRDRRLRLHCAPRQSDPGLWLLPLPALEPAEARARLEGWCREILVDAVQRLLPIEALLEGRAIRDLGDWIQDQEDGAERRSLTCFRGPVPRVKDLPADALETGQRRLGPFLDLQSRWERA
jgi:exodeoxyribonuclease V gamma subunit